MRKRTTCRSRCTMATTIRPHAQAHGMPVASHDSDDDKASCASTRHAGCVARRATTIRPRAQAHDMPVVSHDGDDYKASGNKDNEVNEYHHTSCASAPGFQPSCASARAFSHRAQAHELQRLLWVCINCFCIPRASKKAQGKV